MRTMSNYLNTEQLLSLENTEPSSDQRLPGEAGPTKSWSGNTGTSNGEGGTDDAVGDMIATSLTSLLEGRVI